MWSLQMIDYLNQQAARKARRQGEFPFVPTSPEDVDGWPPFPFPHLGPHAPGGWERTEDKPWFVDSSGFGQAWEPALTVGQFKEVLREFIADHPGFGFAIIEAGQFQVCVDAFRPKVSQKKAG